MPPVNDLGPLLRMMRHVPPEQLARRVTLNLKRRLRVRLEAALPGRWRPTVLAAPRPTPWPQPILPRRHQLVKDGHALLLGRRIPIEPAVDWFPEDAPAGTLARIVLHEHRWLEGLDDDTFQAVLLDWIDQVPPYGPAYWIDAWNAYALAVRVVVWMQELARRPELDRMARRKVQRSLAEQLAFLHRNLETDLGGNHLIKDLKALLWGADCFTGADADAWRETATALLAREIGAQVPEDGLHSERSPAYHLQVLADLLEIHHVLDDGPVRLQLAEALDRMCSAAEVTTAPDGAPLLLGDGGLTMAYTPQTLLQAWQDQGGELCELPDVVPLADAGLYTWRDGDDQVVVDAGPLATDALPAHGHADVLALLWSIDGQRVLVDQGVFEYQGPTRAACRSTRVHNTVTLDDQDQAELFGVFRAGRRWSATVHAWHPRPDGFLLTASHDGYRHLPGRPIHRRTVDVRGRRIRVEDRVEGGAGQRMTARLLLHPACTAKPVHGGAVIQVGNHIIRLTTSSTVRIEAAVWWPDFGVEQPTSRLVLEYGGAPGAGTFTLVAGSGATGRGGR